MVREKIAKMETNLISEETRIIERSRRRAFKSRGDRADCKGKSMALKFSNISPEVFFRSQWPIGDLAFLVYKASVAIYTLVVVAFSIRGFAYSLGPRRPWPVWLTNWSYAALTAYSVCSFVMVLYNRLTRYKSVDRAPMKNPPLYIKVTWALFAVAAPMSYLVTGVFFVALFPRKKLDFIPAGDINIHLMNSVLMTLEIFVGAIPVRFSHTVYSILFGFIYVLFSVAYWSYNPAYNVLYPGVLDWNKPLHTIVVLCIIGVFILPLIQVVQFGLCKLRTKLYRLLQKKNLVEH